jgi:hypothetical protein
MGQTVPLVEILKGIIERTYDIPPLIPEISAFIVGDQGLRSIYGGIACSRQEDGARVLVRDLGQSVRAALYYPDALVRHLERFNPLQGVGDVNIAAFAVLVEEVDHLLTLASRAAEGRAVTLLELEHHACVTKYLMVLHFLGRQTGRRRLGDALKQWARFHLFERYSQGSHAERYREAARLAWQYLKRFEAMPLERRRMEIRAYHRRPFAEVLYPINVN